MKRLLLSLFVLCGGAANATNYYVAASGNDANRGTTAATAWQSLTQVNAFNFAANDSIFFKRGDVFYGSLILKRNNLTISAYGAGAKPVITGFTTVSNWVDAGGGIYECSVNAKSNLNMVIINGRPQQIGRYPNASDANGGYLMYQTGNSASITDVNLSSSVNWTGAEIGIRKNPWTMDRQVVTSQTANGVIYSRMKTSYNSGVSPVQAVAEANHGYFFMNDRRTLDQFGEWYFDVAAKKILVYFGNNVPSNFSVKVSTVDTLIDMKNNTNITVSNLAFEGANMSAVYSMNGGFIKVLSCDMTNIGGKAVHIFNANDVVVDGVNTKNVLCNSIEVSSTVKSNVIVRNCTVRNTAPFVGMGSYYESADNKGMSISALSNVLIEHNVVDSTGLGGIQFNGNDVIVQYNVVSNFCYTLQDGGGIYTWVGGTDALPGKYYTNRIVRKNIVFNGIGAPQGTGSTGILVGGIFLDGRSMNVTVADNTVFNSNKWGVHCNNPSGVTIRDNTLFDNNKDISFMRWAYGSIHNLNIKKNISFSMDPTQQNLFYVNAGLNTPVINTIENNLRSLGSIDSNYYQSVSDAGIATEIYSTEGGAIIPTSPYSLGGWKAATSYDLNSKKPAHKIQPYTLINTIGANKFSNAQFTSNINGVTLFSANATASWDNTGKITGAGSLKITFATNNPGRYCQLHSPIGPVSSSKKYILRFTTLGTSANGIVRAYMRKSASPYNDLIAIQTRSFGTTKINHEFLLDGPTTETAGASYVIAVEEGSGTTYIDNIEFYEANATVNTLESMVRFEYNATNVVKNIFLGAKYIGVDSTIYNGTLTLQPYSSKIIIKAGAVDSMPVVNAGADKVVSLPIDSVMLTGTARGGTITGYTWSLVSGPAPVTITNANRAVAKLTSITEGTYTFRLTATNSAGLSASDTINIIMAKVLPVTLIDFTGRNNNGRINLTWNTSSEINSSYFSIQRSSNGRQFETIGRVNANNSREGSRDYRFTDATPVNGSNYYRLAIVDRDGTGTYSKTVLINTGSNSNIFTVENVSLSSAAVKMMVNSNEAQVMNIRIVDAVGRVFATKQMQLQNGLNVIEAPVHGVRKGVYHVQVFTAKDTITKTVLGE